MAGLTDLEITDFRCHIRLEFPQLDSAWVVLVGPNGSGKSSILEAIYAPARGRSFRTRRLTDLVRAGATEAFVHLTSVNDTVHRLGTSFREGRRSARLDGATVPTLAPVAAAVPVDYIGAEAYRLIQGPPNLRRHFLDWGLFHVEPRFFEVWQAWHRAHRQRNALLAMGDWEGARAWVPAVAGHGARLTTLRGELLERLDAGLRASGDTLLAEGRLRLRFRPGWDGNDLAQAIETQAAREQRTRREVVGPQRDDWTLAGGDHVAHALSRGQAKLFGVSLVRARAMRMQEAGRRAVLLVDDFMADLDPSAIQRGLRLLVGAGAQLWLTALDDAQVPSLPGASMKFHVEPGRLRAA